MLPAPAQIPARAVVKGDATSMSIAAASVLAKVEKGETELSKLGFSGFRLRVTERGARLEIPEEQMPLLIQKRKDILAVLEDDFREITMDLRPRREVEL